MGRPMLARKLCPQCGKVEVDLGRTYCSRDCTVVASRGKPRPDAIGNQWAVRPVVGKWAQYKRMQKMCPKGPCVECGSILMSVIHHIDHNHENTVPENLQRMCRRCHASHHHGHRNLLPLINRLEDRV